MKNFLFAFAASSLLLSSCGKDDEDPKPQPQNPNPPVTAHAVTLESDITQNTTLEDRITDPNFPDYIVNKDIAVYGELTIKPGVVIAFAEDVSMLIAEDGAIFSRGEATKKVRFTGKIAQKGYWAGLDIYSINSHNELLHTEILNAGSIPGTDNVKANVILEEDARLNIRNSLISGSGGYGLYLRDESLLLNFSENTLSNNNEAPLKLLADNVQKLDAASSFSQGNNRNVIEVMRSWINGTGEVVWPAFNDNTPYRFMGSISVQTGWKLLPGVTIEVKPNEEFEIGSNGYMHAAGTTARKITITGVDKTVGSWNGFIFYSRSSMNVIENAEIKYAGGQPMLSNTKAAITITDHSSLSIRNSALTHSGGHGIHVNGLGQINSDVATSNTFTSNTLSDVIYTQ
ncbi:hypothetical protein [Adhaeribacter soli]|uniref:Right-handed parallel beta-helix repeat-containing protein n=1 Tax=Adhaeribacter soli TaxID=2607655 RepID=A0A5N1INT9_9BACT|nr:hypothetical protein [Adhaeribacter soli]KAA9325150.1 hypothetical protein F0P94_18115 [Adhaeribacter soli]